MDSERHCVICLLDSYHDVNEQRAFFELLFEQLADNPNGLVTVCNSCYEEVTKFLAVQN